MPIDPAPDPPAIIDTALCCAEGEAAIEEYEERAAREWLAALVAERDRLRDIARQRDEAEARVEAMAAALMRIRDYEAGEDECAREYGVLEPDKHGYCWGLANAALSAMPADLLAQREREQAVARAATEYRQVNAVLDGEPEPHPDPLARTILIEICEQKRAALFAVVDRLGVETP